MKKLVAFILAFSVTAAFATSAADQAAAKAAMNECLKTKTQQECTNIQQAAQTAKTAS